MMLKSAPEHLIGVPRCMRKLRSLVVLLVLLHEVMTINSNTICSGSCYFDSDVHLSRCTDPGTCTEKVHVEGKEHGIFSDAVVEVCYSEENVVFPASIDSISTQVLNETLSVNTSWKWPAITETRNDNDLYDVYWGMQYSITVPGENQTDCYSVFLLEEYIEQGKLNIPCVKFGADFPFPEFKITSLSFVMKGNYLYPRPSRLQEITISKAGGLTNTSVPVWNSQLKYHLVDNVLTVSFTPAPQTFNYISYDVLVFKAAESKCIPSSSYINKTGVLPSLPTTSVSFTSENFTTECAKFCVGVHPVKRSPEDSCSEGCVTEMHDMVMFHVPSRAVKCRYWNADFVFPPSHPKSLVVSFNVSDEYSFCFVDFEMELFIPSTSDCMAGENMTVREKEFKWNSDGSVITFENLTIGNYCIKVKPSKAYVVCKVNLCYHRYVGALIVADEPETVRLPTDPPFPEIAIRNNVLLISIQVVVVIILLVIVGGFMWQKCRPPREFPPKNDTHPPEGCEAYEALPLALREVVILYTHDEMTRNRVRALSNFLERTENFKVVLDEDHLAEITAEHSSFISEILKYSCPESGVRTGNNANRRIVIVESKRAVKLLRKKEAIMRMAMKLHPTECRNCDVCKFAYNEKRIESDESYSSDDDGEKLTNVYETLDKLFFCLGISFITSTRRHFEDDCHIFVVQFSDSMLPESETFKCQFPGKRYCLPRQLGDLCLNLNRIDHPKVLQRYTKLNEMHERWKHDESYAELLAKCRL